MKVNEAVQKADSESLKIIRDKIWAIEEKLAKRREGYILEEE